MRVDENTDCAAADACDYARKAMFWLIRFDIGRRLNFMQNPSRPLRNGLFRGGLGPAQGTCSQR